MTTMLIQVAVSGLLVAAGIRISRRSPRAATVAAAGMLLLIVLKTAVGYVPTAEPRLFPWLWYPYVEPWWILFPAAFLAGVGWPVVRRSVWKRDVVLIGAGFLLLRSMAVAWGTDRASDLLGTVDAEGICRQTSGYSCSPAASASLLHVYGVEADEREMAGLCVTRSFGSMAGTTPCGIMRGLRLKLANRRTVRITRPTYETLPQPSLVCLQLSRNLCHSVMVSKVDAHGVHVIDPLYGRGTLSRSIFEREWIGTAIFVE